MERHKIYFGKTGLTSTSANALANKAKEYIAAEEIRLHNISFVSSSASLISSDVEKVITVGMDSGALTQVEEMLNKISEMKSLQAWLREAIKAKETLHREISGTTFEKWAKQANKELPVYEPIKPMTEDEYLGNLSIKERNEYYSLEQFAAVLGGFIHLDGPLNKARKYLSEKMANPNKISGEGANAIVYSYTPSVPERDVDTVFFKLTKKHREAQAQLNKLKHAMEVALQKSEAEANAQNQKLYDAYNVEYEKLRMEFSQWKLNALSEIRDLKIQIPNSLKETHDFLTKL